MKRKTMIYSTLCAVMLGLASSAGAVVINGQNWADSVESYTSKIQNYDGVLMDVSTEWWLTGQSDADVNGNGYGWDAGDNDYVAGWRAKAPGENFVVKFDIGLVDTTGDDLVIHLYGGASAWAEVWASKNNVEANYIQIGTIGAGTPGYFRDETFDFSGLFGSDDVHYVKVLRVNSGAGTGVFVDSLASVPEPATMCLLGFGGMAMLFRRKRKAA